MTFDDQRRELAAEISQAVETSAAGLGINMRGVAKTLCGLIEVAEGTAYQHVRQVFNGNWGRILPAYGEEHQGIGIKKLTRLGWTYFCCGIERESDIVCKTKTMYRSFLYPPILDGKVIPLEIALTRLKTEDWKFFEAMVNARLRTYS